MDQAASDRRFAFGFTVLLWIHAGPHRRGPGREARLPRGKPEHARKESQPSPARCLLFILPGDERRACDHMGRTPQIDWGVVLLYGGGFALGVLSFQTGLAEAIGADSPGCSPSAASSGCSSPRRLRCSFRDHVQHRVGQHGRAGRHRHRRAPASIR